MNREQVLIIEDDADIREGVRRLLLRHHLRTDADGPGGAAGSSDAAFESAEAEGHQHVCGRRAQGDV